MISYSRGSILFLFILITIFSFIVIKKCNDKYKKMYFICIIIVFSLYFGLRNFDIGVDTKEYLSRYKLMSGNKDPLFAYLTNFLHIVLFGNKQLYLLSISFLTNFVLGFSLFRLNHKQINKTIICFVITILLPYVILSNVNIIRQGLSMAFILLSLSYLDESKKKCILFALVSIGLHKMMVFFWLIFIVVYNIKVRMRYIFLLAVVICIVLKLPFVIELLEIFKNNFYIEKLLLHISPVSMTAILKIIFYYLNFIILAIISKKTNKSFPILLSAFLAMIFSSAVFSFSELYSMRFLITLEFILPFLYINIMPTKIIIIKKEICSILIILFISFSYLFVSLYLNALTTDLGL